MLAITSTEALSILDHIVLKKAPSSYPSTVALLSPPVASSWSSDNKFLFIASADTIHRYDAEHHSIVDIFSTSESITSLVVKGKSSVIFGAGERVHVLECGSTTKISQTFVSHQDSVKSLSSSCDSTLLASTSSKAAYVHNLTLISHTALRGLPVSDQQSITTCTFHSHARTRLLLGIGKKVVIYDINRPSGPAKVISLSETSSGNICAISCSPFSKTLIAVATTGGTLGLIDLDKEKGLFRTINVKVPIASLSFSQEGASVYLGTENGKLLILDLRSLDKPPKSVVLSENGARLATMSVQAKSASETTKNPPATTKSTELSKPTSRKPSATIASVNKPSPARRIVSVSSKGKEPARLTAGTERVSAAKEKEGVNKKVFSPLRNLLSISNGGNTSLNHSDEFSLQIDTLPVVRDKSKVSRPAPVRDTPERVRDPASSALSNSDSASRIGTSARLRPRPQPSPLSASASRSKLSPKEDLRRTRTVSTTSRTAAVSSPLSASTSKKVNEDATGVSRRTRTVSTSSTRTSRAPKASDVTVTTTESISAAATRTRTEVDHLSVPKDVKKSRVIFPSSHASSSKVETKTGSTSGAGPQSNARTPSPDLSDIEAMTSSGPGPVTPLPASRRRGMASPVLGAPVGIEVNADDDVDLPVPGNKSRKRDSGKGKARTVLFQDSGKEFDNGCAVREASSDDDIESEKENQREESVSWQISPRRPGSIGPSGGPSASSMPWNGSPIRHSQSYLHKQYANIPGSPGGTSPQGLLRNIVRDVMYDFHQESRAEMMSLHLDLVSMGRGWKKELRELMGEYGGELKELREENRRLREENERLRRGY
ncbi:WD40-repeat-containing domain protein [Lentinula edodes]|uniref:WD40-repeat-containing domain protein n=1 Tax=Lentinula edodes TaxID=5353 RepID=UPI001E8D6C99|nr:WD40-repeat-containing domain protein [Lentinula edodes]KAH7870958.1 WD40-repeat-containing domain protein [Lentinula edodes]